MGQHKCKHCGQPTWCHIDEDDISRKGMGPRVTPHYCCERCGDNYEDCPDNQPESPSSFASEVQTLDKVAGSDDALFRRLVLTLVKST